ncbi:MAG: transcriptional repressor [Desulfobacteraceae bacterium]|jgi:hypothetical protein
MGKDRQQNNIQPVLQIFRKHMLKVTPQRVAIYQELSDSDTHPTADAIYQIVKRKFCHISYDTVNRTLRARAKITSHLQAPMHPAWLRCESSKYLDMPSLSRLARRAPQHLKM